MGGIKCCAIVECPAHKRSLLKADKSIMRQASIQRFDNAYTRPHLKPNAPTPKTATSPHLKPNAFGVATGGIKCYAISDAVSVVYKKRRYMSERRRLYDSTLARPPHFN